MSDDRTQTQPQRGRPPAKRGRPEDERVQELPGNFPNPRTVTGERRGTTIGSMPLAAALFEAPPVEIGEIVHYYEGRYSPSKPAQAGLVAEIGTGGKLRILIAKSSQSDFTMLTDECRHKDDPTPHRRDVEDTEEYGVWCHPPGAFTLSDRLRIKRMLTLFAKENGELDAEMGEGGLPDVTRRNGGMVQPPPPPPQP